jgi:hypothetical protein
MPSPGNARPDAVARSFVPGTMVMARMTVVIWPWYDARVKHIGSLVNGDVCLVVGQCRHVSDVGWFVPVVASGTFGWVFVTALAAAW